MKNNRGVSIISFILVICILAVIAFLGYQIFYEDILNLGLADSTVINTLNINAGYVNSENYNSNTVSSSVQNNNYASSKNISSNYYYNQLDNYGKLIYTGLAQNKEEIKSGEFSVDFGNQFNDLLNSDGGEEQLNIAFQSAWNAYTYDNMDVFYIDVEKLTLTTRTTTIGSLSTHRVVLSNGDNSNCLKDDFYDRNKIDSKLNLIESIRDAMEKQLEGYSDYEKIRQVHNWLIENVEYDEYFEAEEPYSISGALTEGKAVCEGYARSFKYILDELEIPCILVSGTGTNSNGETESHAWNYVLLEGEWYAVDVTWDDPVIIGSGYVSNDIYYENFLKGQNTFFRNHTEDGYLSANSQKFTFPEISVGDY